MNGLKSEIYMYMYIYIIESLERRRFFPLQQKLNLKDIIIS